MPEAPGQELSGHPGVRVDGGQRQCAVNLKVSCEVGSHAVDTRHIRGSSSADTLLTQEEQQQRQRLSFLAARLRASGAAPSATSLESFNVDIRQCGNFNLMPLAPSAEG